MPDLSVSESQLERLEEISAELETVYVGEYGTVRSADALQYLLDTYSPPDADSSASASDVDIAALTAIEGVGEATAESLVDAGFPTVERVVEADPEAIADLDGVGPTQAVDIVASATEIVSNAEEGESAQPSDDAAVGPGENEAETPENTLQQAMSLLDTHDDRWRESSGDEPYEVDLPDGSTKGVRTKDDIKRLIFKHWQ